MSTGDRGDARRRAAALLGLGLLLSACTSSEADEVQAVERATVAGTDTDLAACPDQPDEPAADSDLSAVPPIECFTGGTLDLGLAQGVPTVLNLWASWCQPCREELPWVQQLAGLAGDRVRVVGVVSQDGVPQAASFADDAGVTLPGAFDGQGDVAAALGLRGLPHTVFLTADGSVAFVRTGQVTSLDELRALVAEHLGVQL
ncbi:thiol-disulfide isomerase/thioredoxin [Geodermatophilus bullaregiensis]|uniref:TlpA family protein disulfide reductase n=1 Tax=Geodermatophilus bullaregiensis TaxID=1564160 RepID=UPI00195D4D39|nr:TlpA disulfide reductase family protein [Geodermatophilus bullaregiensis]MBM7807106.1 thiol-disulfide isomerase/thioredoxin [Geodermatophilus bullaregiensis]